MKIAVLADTHIPKRAKDLPDSAYEILRGVDLILHAGDLISEDFLLKLRGVAPVHAVLGNNDFGLNLPEIVELEVEGVKIAMIHDSGQKEGRGKRMRKRFPHANVVVFGHSHIPINEQDGDLLLFNPGSPTDKRRQPVASLGILLASDGIVKGKIVPLSSTESLPPVDKVFL